MFVSEKQQQRETYYLNDVATWFRCGGTFDHYFITNLLL